MKSKKWPMMAELERLIGTRGPESVPAGAFNAIADRLEAAVASSDGKELAHANEQLEDLVRLLVQHGSDSLRAAVRGRGDQADISAALSLGQAAFAQAFASRALDKRADDRFAQRMRDPRYEAYVRALLNSPLNGKQLEQAVDEAKETVSRKLAILRGLGIVECRREGNRIVNFLNPAARAILLAQHVAPLPIGKTRPIAPSVVTAIGNEAKGIADYYSKSPVFGAA